MKLEVPSYTTPGGVKINSVNFNQDYSSVCVGTQKGCKLFALTSDHQVEEICDIKIENICIVEHLFSTNIVATVSKFSQRSLNVWNFKENLKTFSCDYPDNILSVKVNHERLVVCVEEVLFIHNMKDGNNLLNRVITPSNLTGLFALSTRENSFIAYPGSRDIGIIQIFDASTMQSKLMIDAHKNPLTAIQFNYSGTIIASASKEGTVIRVFNSENGTKLFEFRRGLARSADINSLSFSSNSCFLLCSSNFETVHLFKLRDTSNEAPEESFSIASMLRGVMTASASYLPNPISDMIWQERAFATATLPFQGIKNSGGITLIQNQPRILVASADGLLYVYLFNTANGGTCTLLNQHNLFDDYDKDGSEGSSTTNE